VRLAALGAARSAPLGTALAISVAAHLAVYGLTPVLSLHLVALGASSTQVGVLFSVFSLVAVVLRPVAGAWIDRRGIRRALFAGAVLVILSSLGFQAVTAPPALVVLMAVFGVGFGLVTMAAAMLAASAPAERRAEALSVYYLAAPVAMAIAAPLGLWLFRHVGVRANFTLVTMLGLGAAACGWWSPRSTAGGRAGSSPLWSRGAVPLSIVVAIAAMGQSALYAFLPLHAADHGHERHLPWFFGLYSVGMIVFRAAVSGIAGRVGRSQILLPALGCLAAGFGVLIAPPTPARLAVAAILLAVGSSALYPMLVALVVERVPDRERGVAMGSVSGGWDLGAFAGALLIGAVAEHGSHGAGFATATAFIVIALGTFLLVERRSSV